MLTSSGGVKCWGNGDYVSSSAREVTSAPKSYPVDVHRKQWVDQCFKWNCPSECVKAGMPCLLVPSLQSEELNVGGAGSIRSSWAMELPQKETVGYPSDVVTSDAELNPPALKWSYSS